MSRAILGSLQVSIDEVIRSVQLIYGLTGASGGARRGDVGVDRSLPISKAREGMGGHVQCVRSGGRDLSVVLRGVQGPSSQRRHIVSVDDVVRQSRVIRKPSVQGLEYLSRFQLPRVSLVGRVGGSGYGKCVEPVGPLNRSAFPCFGIRSRHGRPQRQISRGHRSGDLKIGNSVDVVAFVLGFGMSTSSLDDCLGALLRLGLRFCANREGIAPMAGREPQ